MNPMARPKSGSVLPETIVYPDPEGASGFDSNAPHPRVAPPDSFDMGAEPNSTKISERYIFGSGARPLEGYTIKRAIGRGGFGEVYYAISDAGKEVALKLLLRNIDIEKRGVQQCMNLKSPHLITIYDMRTSEEGDTFVVMEYVSGPSLAQILARYHDGLPPQEVRMWLRGLVEGVSYLHDHGIVHRDLKPANLFLEEGVVKIGDYGLSKFIANSVERGHSTSVGTCHYMAPEIATGKYQKPIDIYAMGIIIYEMLTGTVPFVGETAQEVLMKHLTAQPDLSPLPEPYRTTVERALSKDPTRRPQNAIDLLMPEDMPATPSVRFIGEQKTSPATLVDPAVVPSPTPDPAPAIVSNEPPASAEEVLQIGEEEPIFYIGPNTMPPRRGLWDAMAQQRRTARQAGMRAWKAAQAARAATRGNRRPAAPPAMPVSSGYRKPALNAPVEVLKPVPLPCGRIRLAETASSMLMAAPLSLLAGLLGAAVLGLGIPKDSDQIALLCGMILLGSWAVLIPWKVWEGRVVDSATRRMTMGAIGLGLGGTLLGLADWVHLDYAGVIIHAWDGSAEFWTNFGVEPSVAAPLGLLAALGLVFAVVRWDQLVARDRARRFRIVPLIRIGLGALLAGLVLPAPMPWLPVYAVLLSVVVQLISPWCRDSSRYATALRRQRARGVSAA